MTHHRTAEAIRHLGDAARTTGLADAALLAQFAVARDQAAFAELVRRHGPLVLGVCRRVAGHRQDAEDAFQATFLILAVKAKALADPGRLGSWLYGVAYRVARKARRAAARRRAREVQVATFPDPHAVPTEAASELGPVLDAALAGLPEVYRTAVVLCDLQQKSRAEAAALLGVPEGTLSSRLATGRKRLAERLARRGVAVSTAALGAILAERGTAALPGDLAAKTADVVTAWTTGGIIAANLRYLMSDGGPVMWKATGVIAAAVAAVGLAVGAAAAWPGADPEQRTKPTAKAEPQAKAAVGDEKPAKSTKPRLFATTTLEGTTARPVWSPDGSLLAITTGSQITLYDGRTLRAIDTFPTAETGSLVGFCHDKPALVTYIYGPRRINSITQLRFWALPGKDARGAWVSTGSHMNSAFDFDSTDGWPFAVSPDGKSVMTVVSDRKQKAADDAPIVTATRFRVLDARTGEVIRELAKLDGLTTGFAVSPDGRRLVLVSRSAKGEAVVECLDVESGRQLWTRTYGERADPGQLLADQSSVLISADGSRVSVTAAVTEYERGAIAQRGPGGRPGSNPFGGLKDGRPSHIVGRVLLLDMSDGGPFHPPEGTADESWAGLGFSHDGKLFVGRSGPGRSDSQLCVWDVRSGKAVKKWDGSANAAFAPDRPTLAVLEQYSETDPNTPHNGFRAVNKSSLGLWDLSALTK